MFSCCVSILFSFSWQQILRYLDDRCKVHNDTISLCQDVLRRRSLDWEAFLCNRLNQPIRHVDLVISVGGDGTLLQASHFIDDSIPIVGVNSDPTRVEEVSIRNVIHIYQDNLFVLAPLIWFNKLT